jgi:hypothetical protein
MIGSCNENGIYSLGQALCLEMQLSETLVSKGLISIRNRVLHCFYGKILIENRGEISPKLPVKLYLK